MAAADPIDRVLTILGDRQRQESLAEELSRIGLCAQTVTSPLEVDFEDEPLFVALDADHPAGGVSQLLRRLSATPGQPAFRFLVLSPDSTSNADELMALADDIFIWPCPPALLEARFNFARKRLQRRVRAEEMERRLRFLDKALDTLQLGVTVRDLAGKVLYTNPAEAAMHGYEVDELLGNSVRILSPEDTWKDLDANALRRIRSWTRNSVNRHRDGHDFPVLLHSDVVFGDGGEPTAIVTACEPIAERLAERSSLRFLEKAVETMQLGLTVTDVDGIILYQNAADARIHGWDPGDLIGRDVRLLAPQQRRRQLGEEQLRTLTSWQRDTLNARKDGSVFPVRLFSDVVLNDDDEPVAVITTCEDISRRRSAEEALRQSEEQYRAIIANIDDGYFEVNRQGRLVRWNLALARILEEPTEGLEGLNAWRLIDRGTRRTALQEFRKILSGGSPERFDLKVIGRKGARRWIEISASPATNEHGQVAGMRGIVRDVTIRRRAETDLRESEGRFRELAEQAPVVIWVSGVPTDIEALFKSRWVNTEAHRVESELAVDWLDAIEEQDLEACRTEFKDAVESSSSFRFEYRLRLRSGEQRWILDHGTPRHTDDGQMAGFIGSCLDISDQKRAEAQLKRSALHDDLTGLPNRALLIDRLEGALARAKRHDDAAFGVLFLDLDRFKLINDSVGHLLGDKFLQEIAGRITQDLRSADTLARLGGDEFVILIDRVEGPNEASRIAERIQERIHLPVDLEGHRVIPSASIGIALFSPSYERADEILRDADIAMYRAKALGRSRQEVFDRSMHEKAMRLLEIESDLRRAIERDEIFLMFQPIIDLKSGLIASCEALVRWQHPREGLINPAEFIGVAEDSGLINPLGERILELACVQARRFRESQLQRRIPISINVSARQFSEAKLLPQFSELIEANDLDPISIRLELTESAIVQDPGATRKVLEEISALGVEIHLDDFGTGYSSLTSLADFPIAVLKIDRSFIARMGPRGENAQMVGSIISLARGMGMRSVAEGVETAVQLAQLRALQCDFGQGYFFARPKLGDELIAMVRKDQRF